MSNINDFREAIKKLIKHDAKFTTQHNQFTRLVSLHFAILGLKHYILSAERYILKLNVFFRILINKVRDR